MYSRYAGRLPFPPPGFPRINAKRLSSSGEEADMEDMKLRLEDLVDAHRRGPHRPNIVGTLERRIWEPHERFAANIASLRIIV